MELAEQLHSLVWELDNAAEELLRSEFGMSHSQLAFLMPLLHRSDLDVSSHAVAMGVTVPAVSKRTNWFVDRGLVASSRPPGDARRVVLNLTPAGRQLASEASAALAQRVDRLLAEWPESRRNSFGDMLCELTAAVRLSRVNEGGIPR